MTGTGTGLGAAIAGGAARRGAKAVILNYAKRKEAEATAQAVQAAGAEAHRAGRRRRGCGLPQDRCRRRALRPARCALQQRRNDQARPATPTSTALSKEDFLRIYAVNAVGPYQMIRACRPPAESRAAAPCS